MTKNLESEAKHKPVFKNLSLEQIEDFEFTLYCTEFHKLQLKLDKSFHYYLLTYVSNYKNDFEKAITSIRQGFYNFAGCEQLAIAYEINSRGYLHAHCLVAFSKVPFFKNFKTKGCTFNFVKVLRYDNSQDEIDRILTYMYKDFDEYGFSHGALNQQYDLKNKYCIIEEESA